MASNTKIINIESAIRSKKGGCDHSEVYVDRNLAELVCKKCEQKLNPIEFIVRMGKEQAANQKRERELMLIIERLENASTCTCEHCGKKTRVEG